MPEAEKSPENELDFEWMVRPCGSYQDEYKDCKSIKARFNQYFIFGKTLDCTQWKVDYDNCYQWENYKSKKALKALVESEKIRRYKRLKGHYENNVWEKRDKPPENWNAPLPDWLEERRKKSYLRCVLEESAKQKNEGQKSSCTIM